MSTRLGRYCAGVMEAGWLLALIVSPLFFQNIYSLRVFEPDRIALIRTLALIVLAAWLVRIAAEPRPVPGQPAGRLSGTFRQFPLLAPVAALIVVYLVATLFSVSPWTSFFGSYRRLQGTLTTLSYLVFFLAVVSTVRRRAQVERILTAIIVTSLPVSLYGLIQRCRLDPLEWGGGTVERISSALGNPIFLAAYLILPSLLVLGRLTTLIGQIRTRPGAPGARVWLRITLHALILTCNLLAIYFTFSRGPLLGLLSGLVAFVILSQLRFRAGAVAAAAVGVSLAVAVGMGALVSRACPLGPVSGPTVGRLGQVLETETGTGLVRMLIWHGVVGMMTPHPPIVSSAGTPDRWNAIRPVIGYGPETMRVVFAPFYPPELAHAEGRALTADRSHNETFDALVTTGVVGAGVHLALYVVIFYYALKWLGVLRAEDRASFLGLILAGSAVTTLGLVLWRGWELLGVGLSLGMIAGLLVFLLRQAWRTRRLSPLPERDTWPALLLITLFAAVVAHAVEITFGIAIASTRTHFWILAALVQVLGVATFESPATAESERSAPPSSRTSRRARRQKPRAPSKPSPGPGPAPTLVAAGLTTVLLITLGYDFINNPTRTTRVGEILTSSLSRISSGGALQPSYGIMGLLIVTWVIGGTVALLEETESRGAPLRGGDVAAALGLSMLFGFLSWWIVGAYLASLRLPQAGAQLIPQLLHTANRIAGVLSVYYVLLVLALASWAATVSPPAAARPPRFKPRGLALGVAVTLGVVVAPVLSVTLNLRNTQADIVAKIAFQQDRSGRSQLAVPLFRRAVELAPGEGFYSLLLGKAILNTITPSTEASERDRAFALAEAALDEAQRREPLDPDNAANLARLHREWAQMLSGDAERTARGDHARQASAYFERVLRMSPYDARLWNEWATLTLQLLEDPDGAQARLDRSFAVDRQYDQTYLVQGDLYTWRAQHATAPARTQQNYQKAIDAYREGIRIAQSQGGDSTALHVNLGAAYVATHQVREGIEEYLRAVALRDPKVNQWQLQFQIARLYAQLGEAAPARRYAEAALAAAPEASKDAIRAFLAALK